ncbi:MAG: phosphoglycerate dehydrogenase [Spirochaetes bacterium]|nr:phosphoglycerate dehydrogenase [Spirochaetota bacterium]
MFKIMTVNKISPKGLELFPRDQYEVASELSNPDAIIVRSSPLHEMEFPESVKAIARAGVGTNNIPVERCTEKGIVVFNTPGANANAVKELVVAGLLLSCRRIHEGISWTKSLLDQTDDIPGMVEQNKNQFAGPELMGKTLGVIGLGAIGVMVANAAIGLGMRVIGYDPFISVESAWRLSREVIRAEGLESLLRQSDFITLHTPLTDKTRGLLNEERFTVMKKGVRIMNFARGGLVNNEDLIEALQTGQVAKYVTDFPEAKLLKVENVLCLPHLGASTPEAEENCAIMAVTQLKTFLETGNISRSVNFPDCTLERTGKVRLTVSNFNIPNMVGQITAILAKEKINISDLLNRHKDGIAYNIIDLDSDISDESLKRIQEIDGVIRVRKI